MRESGLVIICVILLLHNSACDRSSGREAAERLEPRLDFQFDVDGFNARLENGFLNVGRIEQSSDPLIVKASIRNESVADIVLGAVSGSCTCTELKFSPGAIAIGDKSEGTISIRASRAGPGEATVYFDFPEFSLRKAIGIRWNSLKSHGFSEPSYDLGSVSASKGKNRVHFIELMNSQAENNYSGFVARCAEGTCEATNMNDGTVRIEITDPGSRNFYHHVILADENGTDVDVTRVSWSCLDALWIDKDAVLVEFDNGPATFELKLNRKPPTPSIDWDIEYTGVGTIETTNESGKELTLSYTPKPGVYSDGGKVTITTVEGLVLTFRFYALGKKLHD